MVHRRVFVDCDHGDVSDDGELRERRRAHKMQEVLALASEPLSAIRQDALPLGGTDLSTEVRLARLAGLALPRLWRAVSDQLPHIDEKRHGLLTRAQRHDPQA